MTLQERAPFGLLVGTDNRFARPAAVTIASALRHLPPGFAVQLTVVDGGLSAVSARRIRRVIAAYPSVQLSWRDASQFDMSDLHGGPRGITAAAYLRLFVAHLFDEHVKRVVYLDSDILVRRSLEELWLTDLGGKTLAAARDMVIGNMGHEYSGAGRFTPDLDRGLPYFNSGVLVFDLERWRNQGAEESVLRWAREYGDQSNFDQDALNAVLHGDWNELDLRWNVQGSLLLTHEHSDDLWSQELEALRPSLLSDPFIVHFSGGFKPWHMSSVNPFRVEWARELHDAGFYGPTMGGWVDTWLRSQREFGRVARRRGLMTSRERV